MKKFIVIALLIIIVGSFYKVDKDIIIPDNSIRLRVIPNSNSSMDINMKLKVKNYLEDNLYLILKDANSIDEAREIINNQVDDIDNNVRDIFLKNNYDMDYTINFGNNYFPEKEFYGVKYSSGEYESLVISIGEGNGDNFWCVLFPNYCLGEVDDKTEYSFFVKKLFDKLF